MPEHRRPHAQRANRAANRSRFGRGVAVIALIATLLAGCSSSSSGGSSDSSGPATSGSANSTLTAVQSTVADLMKPSPAVQLNFPAITGMPNLKGRTILLVPILGLVFSTAIKQVQAALSKVGAKTQVCDGQGNPSTVATCLSQAPSISGIAGVMTIGVPYQAVPSAIATVTGAHIPVLIAQQNADGQPASDDLAFVGTTKLFQVATKAADDYVIAKSDGKADVLTLGLSESADVRAATTTMTGYLKSACPGCSVSTASVASTQISDASNIVSAAVLKDSKLNWLVSLNSDVSDASVVKGLQSANATTKVVQGGVGNGVASLQGVKSGQAGYTAMVSGELLSYNWTDALLRLIAHNKVPTDYPVVVRLIDKTNVGSLDASPQGELSFGWFGGKDTFAAAYAKLWGAA